MREREHANVDTRKQFQNTFPSSASALYYLNLALVVVVVAFIVLSIQIQIWSNSLRLNWYEFGFKSGADKNNKLKVTLNEAALA